MEDDITMDLSEVRCGFIHLAQSTFHSATVKELQIPQSVGIFYQPVCTVGYSVRTPLLAVGLPCYSILNEAAV